MGKSLEQRVNELEKIVKNLVSNKKTLISKSLCIGDTFELAGLKWKILDITDKGHMCLADKLDGKKQFDADSNDWKNSSLRKFLNTDIHDKIADEIGADNIIPFGRDLLSLDGQTEYGKCEDSVSLLTFDEYRKYRSLISNTDDYYWWLVTPDSTKCNGDSRWVRIVCPSGGIGYGNCNYGRNGVRPFCIFSSLIFESEE